MTTIKTEIVFGNKYRDTNSGFEGVAVAITKWQYGCIRVTLCPKVGADGKRMDSETFDEEGLENIKPNKYSGGPTPEPKTYCNPKQW